MTDLLLVYITCESVEQARVIGKVLMDKRVCACVNIVPEMISMSFWPPKKGVIEEGKEVILIAKTLERKYQQLEREVRKIHTYEVPCILAIPIKHVSQPYYQWLAGEIEGVGV